MNKHKIGKQIKNQTKSSLVVSLVGLGQLTHFTSPGLTVFICTMRDYISSRNCTIGRFWPTSKRLVFVH